MPAKEASPLSLSAVLLNGLPTVILPPRPYRRVMRTISVVNSAGGPVVIYRGTVGAPTRITGFPQGADNEYNTPFNLPSGQSAFVQWENVPSLIQEARATFTWMEIA